MTKKKKVNAGAAAVAELIDALNEDLAREYQAIMAGERCRGGNTPASPCPPLLGLAKGDSRVVGTMFFFEYDKTIRGADGCACTYI